MVCDPLRLDGHIDVSGLVVCAILCSVLSFPHTPLALETISVGAVPLAHEQA